MLLIECRTIVIICLTFKVMAHVKTLQKFGENVRRLRIESDLSQEALAERCGLHRTYVGSIERGERNVAMVNILKIAHALNTSIAELFTGVELD